MPAKTSRRISKARRRALEPDGMPVIWPTRTVTLEIELEECLYRAVRAMSRGSNYTSNVEQTIITALRAMAGHDREGGGLDLMFLAALTASENGLSFQQALFGHAPHVDDRRELYALLTGKDPHEFFLKYLADEIGGDDKEAWARRVAKQLAADLNERDAIEAARELGDPSEETTALLLHWLNAEFAERKDGRTK
jgi:hypothetical protein